MVQEDLAISPQGLYESYFLTWDKQCSSRNHTICFKFPTEVGWNLFGQKVERKIFAVGRHKKFTPICGWRVKPAKWAFNMMII